MKRGFTLIELAIVITVIGLLIGGVLVGRNMMAASRINGLISQVSKYDTDLMAYEEKNQFMPSDNPANGGDGDDYIEMSASTTNDNWLHVFTCEISNYWGYLYPDEFSTTPCVTLGNTLAITSGAGKNVPLSKLGKDKSFIYVSTAASWIYIHTNPTYTYYIVMPENGVIYHDSTYKILPTYPNNSAVKPYELQRLDEKMDDGIANTGLVVSGVRRDFSNLNGSPDDQTGSPLCASGGTYLYQNTGYECTPMIRVRSNTGKLE